LRLVVEFGVQEQPDRSQVGAAVGDGSVRLFVDDAAESTSSKDADVVLSSGGQCLQGCGLAQEPVRPVRIVVINVFGDGVL
jgi:hypothetical protein